MQVEVAPPPGKSAPVKSGSRRRAAGIAAVAFVVLATVVWLFGDGSPGVPEGPAIEQSDELPAAMVVATDRKLRRQTGDRARSGSGVPQSADATAAPAEGYSVVRHLGRMVEGGTMARGDGDRPAGPDWLRRADGPQRLAALAAAAGRPWTLGYVELASAASRTSVERSLADAGARIVGSSGRLIRARLPGDVDALRKIASLPGVAGLGAVPAAVKLRGFDDEGGAEADGGALPVFVTLMEGDGDGGWRRRMEALGATVGAYDADTRAYTATATRETARLLADSDFAAAVEPVREVAALNDTAVPAMGADAVRAWNGTPGMFSGSGGASVPVGVMDTGLNLNHPDIRTGRDSVCGAVFPWLVEDPGREEELAEREDLWIDRDGHGTHVTGTLAGKGADDPRFAGMAPEARHIRFAKVLNRYGGGTDDTIRRGMDYLAQASECGGAAAKPLLVNMSLGDSSRSFAARTAGERKLDATVWGHGQLYVVAQGNAASSGFSDYGAAKNSLSVAAAHDTGGQATFTSVGPTADGRLAPQVSGTGVHVHSARGDGSPGGYDRLSGTSMAAPAVSGVAALLMDAVPEHRGRPALARARLMASAIRPDAWLDDPEGFPADNTGGPGTFQNVYGMGKVSARTAILERDRADGWRSGSATVEPEDGEYAYVDIDVPEGASRLDLVMTWDEPPAEAIADSVLNDLDLWLDRGGDCGGAECGEHSSASRVDNVEWIVVRDPEPGTYRAKVAARAVYTAPPRAALAWTVIRGPSTPQLRIEATPSTLGAESVRDVRLEVSVDGYLAAGTQLRFDCRGGDGSPACDGVTIESVAVETDGGWRGLEAPDSARREHSPDGEVVWFLGSWSSLGEVAAGGTRAVRLRVRTGTDPALLRIAADAWNAKAAAATVDIAGGVSVPAVPSNDDFAAAVEIAGAEGSVDLDLFAATPEPGEPELAIWPFVRRPAASAWYSWTAPEAETVHFALKGPDGPSGEHVRVEAFDGARAASLAVVAHDDSDGISFAAEQGRSYRIRVAGFQRAEAVSLRWFSGRPANDDFVDAVVLDGKSGRMEGTNAGATLEPGESWGSLQGTTWYRWTAPEDGDWEFSAGRRPGENRIGNTLVFQGEAIGSLRLVSAVSPDPTRLRGGQEYRIAVASALHLTGTYYLRWSRTNGKPDDNDSFAFAEDAGAAAPSSVSVGVDRMSSVEHGEPVETGVRTRWWKWEAPEDGRYTWRIEDREEYPPFYRFQGLPRLQARAFAGGSLDELELLGRAGPEEPWEFAVNLLAGETVHVSVGFPAAGHEAYDVREASATLAWGMAPPNDGIAAAALLDAGYGSVSGSNRYATTDAGVRVDVAGRSAVWWTFEAPADGWYRFAADGEGGPWAVAVHDGAGDEVTASSRWQRSESGRAEVLFYAAAGSRHAVSLGTVDGGAGGEFTLSWDTAEPPLWLRYAGRLADGYHDGSGNPVEIRMPGELAFGGETLYLASGIGLQAFGRDTEGGTLSFEQLLDGDLERASVAWDDARKRLLAHDCGTWRSYDRNGDGRTLADPEELHLADDSAACGWLLVTEDGNFVYRIGESGIDALDVDEDGGLSLADSHGISGLKGAALTAGGLLYAVGDDGMTVLERDAVTGGFAVTRTDHSFTIWTTQSVPLATTDDGGFLFAVDDDGTHVFSLDDPLDPERLATLPKRQREWFWRADWEWCGSGVARGPSSLDVFCRSQAFVAQWRPDEASLSETDYLDDRLPGRFNNAVPDFGQPRGIAVSPDGRHVYASTAAHGILTFERVATPRDAERLALPDGPDLAVVSVSVANPLPLHGQVFRVDATVRNRGTAGSDSSTLRFYRSSDSMIDPDEDDEEATRHVRRLDAGGEADLISSMTAPSGGGTYYYGVCVDAVDEESDTTNNCSRGVEVRVATPDLVVETPAVDDDAPEAGASFTLSVTVRNRGDGRSSGSATLRYYRSSDGTVSSDDTEVGTDVVGILQPGADGGESIRLTAPSSAGTYYYGACVDAVDGESDTANNCSDGVEVEVSEGGGGTDDHGDTFADATLLSIPSTTAGELEEAGDRDYFRAEVEEAGTYSVETTGGTDTYGTVFDGDGTLLEENDDGGNGRNFRIESDLEPGTYYVEVRGFSSSTTGSYEVAVRRESGGGGGDSYCRDDDTIQPDGECEIHSTNVTFDVSGGGRGCVRSGGINLCNDNSMSYRNTTINGETITLVADRNSDDSWTIDDVEPEPE